MWKLYLLKQSRTDQSQALLAGNFGQATRMKCELCKDFIKTDEGDWRAGGRRGTSPICMNSFCKDQPITGFRSSKARPNQYEFLKDFRTDDGDWYEIAPLPCRHVASAESRERWRARDRERPLLQLRRSDNRRRGGRPDTMLMRSCIPVVVCG